ncbi:Piezo family [Plasmopara halstedii]|uniref:Piezo family n=1 Tax=Plasmopara halstedii TaxID=4781 RepID=A0A0P1AU46_PLAHL|nr:Piezo family [Plasmopara halstedii]CEG44737.1 Piezo family [Plasmopara halstedii]|eukprot:XP_024581106.1 Piezo family [Plasmopara halstedii]
MDVVMKETFPWRAVADTYDKWFMLNNQQKWGLMTDFIALFSVYHLPDTKRFTEEEEVVLVSDESAFSLKLICSRVEEVTKSTAKAPSAMKITGKLHQLYKQFRLHPSLSSLTWRQSHGKNHQGDTIGYYDSNSLLDELALRLAFQVFASLKRQLVLSSLSCMVHCTGIEIFRLVGFR